MGIVTKVDRAWQAYSVSSCYIFYVRGAGGEPHLYAHGRNALWNSASSLLVC